MINKSTSITANSRTYRLCRAVAAFFSLAVRFIIIHPCNLTDQIYGAILRKTELFLKTIRIYIIILKNCIVNFNKRQL